MNGYWQLRDPVSRGPLKVIGDALVSAEGRQYPIRNEIPRFVEAEDYVANFGLEWTIHNRTQLDSVTGTTLTRERLERCLREPVANLEGKTVLEAGCGAGRFTELLVGAGAQVCSFDMSRAVDANKGNIGDRDNYLIAQASVYEIPFEPASFDYVIALGMIQHTPDPEATIEKLYEMVKPGGRLVIDHYRWNLKYFMRAVPWARMALKNVEGEKAKRICFRMAEALFPLHWALRNNPFGAKLLRMISPCAMPDSRALPMLEKLGREQAFDWLVLDTFDALTDRYKHLRTPRQIQRTLSKLGAAGIETSIGGNGVEASCTKPRAANPAIGG
jgi:2-polyprenyl-3-methyl-5-hydroxy-6-metoxy-1,4-benzoquinol methylase